VEKFTVDIWTQQCIDSACVGSTGQKQVAHIKTFVAFFIYCVLIWNDYHLKGHFISAKVLTKAVMKEELVFEAGGLR